MKKNTLSLLRKISIVLYINAVATLHAFSSTDTTHNYSNFAPHFPLLKILIANSESKVKSLRFPKSDSKILILDISTLNTKEFADKMSKYFGNDINAATIKAISEDIKIFLATKGYKQPDIYVPDQNISNGELRLAVIDGEAKLAHLCLTSIQKINTSINYNELKGQIYINDLPSYIGSKEFALKVSNDFTKPINPDLINQLIADISSFISHHGGYLAGIQIPKQNTSQGNLKIGLVIGRYDLKKIIICGSDSESKMHRDPKSSSLVEAYNNPIYATKEFEQFISKYLNQPITITMVMELRNELAAYGKAHDRFWVETTNPYIDLDKGEIRVGVVIGKYDKLHFKGNRWFSDEILNKNLGIKMGDEIKVSELDNAISWANQNPFRQVQVVLDQMNKPLGIADADIAVYESLPIRLSVSYSNAINSPIGNSSYTSSMQIGNLWGLEHEMTFQYSTNNTPRYDQSYSFSYKAPILWHNFIRADVAYSLVYPQALFGYKGLNEKAKNTVVDLRYIKPIKRGLWSFENSAGIDYKQISTNILFGSITNPVAVYDIAQFLASSTCTHKDPGGSFTFGISADFSPGNINNRNTTAVYSQSGITGRSVRYTYGKIIAERDTNLPWQMVWVSRAQFQVASTNLEGSEQILLGGGATVRGYAQSYTGDQGWILNQELRSKYFQLHIPFTNKNKYKLNSQFVSFLDYGGVSYKHVKPADVALPRLMGTGIGVRSSIYGNFSMGSDMSWPIMKLRYQDSHPAKGTFWASLAY